MNTAGSFHCGCEVGFRILENGNECEDSDECQLRHGGCELGCSNTIGSYECYCEHGHQIYNGTGCESDITCDVIVSGALNSSENRYTCKGGFQLSVTNLCDVDKPQSNSES